MVVKTVKFYSERTSGEVTGEVPGNFGELPGKSGDVPEAWGSPSGRAKQVPFVKLAF